MELKWIRTLWIDDVVSLDLVLIVCSMGCCVWKRKRNRKWEKGIISTDRGRGKLTETDAQAARSCSS